MKKEFRECKLQKEPVKPDRLQKGELFPRQKLIARFLSYFTPYSSLLLVDQMGTGKTCSVIGAVELCLRQQEQFVELKHVRVLAGKEFWSWLNGGIDETQSWILESTRLGSESAFADLKDTPISEAPQKLAQELSEKYDLSLEGPIDWEKLLIAINN